VMRTISHLHRLTRTNTCFDVYSHEWYSPIIYLCMQPCTLWQGKGVWTFLACWPSCCLPTKRIATEEQAGRVKGPSVSVVGRCPHAT
jgi:hypothetical protein